MTRPDLSDNQDVARYRAELRAVGRNQRLAGFALVILGAIAVWSVTPGSFLARYLEGVAPAVQGVGYSALAFGWVLMLAAIFLRTRYHRRRMREMD